MGILGRISLHLAHVLMNKSADSSYSSWIFGIIHGFLALTADYRNNQLLPVFWPSDHEIKA